MGRWRLQIHVVLAPSRVADRWWVPLTCHLNPRGMIQRYPLCRWLEGPQSLAGRFGEEKTSRARNRFQIPWPSRAGKCSRTDIRISFAKGKFGRGCQIVLFIWVPACVGAGSLASSALLARSALLPLTIPDPNDRCPPFKGRCADDSVGQDT